MSRGPALPDGPSVTARLALTMLFVACGVYVGTAVGRGWVPHDEGLLAQSAERFLAGERQHRDFVGAYTGGLTLLHAAAFRLLGTRLSSLRIPLFLSFLAFLPAVYAIARRFLPRAGAGLVLLLTSLWTLPIYPAGIPSWYNLFLAAFGVLCLLWYQERRQMRWLVAAGLCAGISILFKIVGIYFVAAAVLFLLYDETIQSSTPVDQRRREPYSLALRVGVAATLTALVFLLVRSRLAAMEMVHFVLPTAAVAFVMVRREAASTSSLSFGWRLRQTAARLVPFGVGLLIPLLLFGSWYALDGSLFAALQSVIDVTARQVSAAGAAVALPPLRDLLPALPYGAVLAFARPGARPLPRAVVALVSLSLATMLVLVARENVYRTVWLSARSLGALAVLLGAALLLRRRPSVAARIPEGSFYLVLCCIALLGLVQYPFSAPIYFCYIIPFVAIAVAALGRRGGSAWSPIHAAVGLFYAALAVLWLNPGFLWNLGFRPDRYRADGELAMPRGGLRVPSTEARIYDELVSTISAHAGGPEIWAGPDAPEVYFLTARQNPTKTFYDFQGPDYGDPAATLDLLERRGIQLVVINGNPSFSRPLSRSLMAALSERFPFERRIGDFLVRWRTDSSPRDPPL